MAQSFPLSALPRDILFGVISQANAPQDIINLQQTNQAVNQALQCETETQQSNDRFVQEATLCQLSGQQVQLFNQLNTKFQLQIPRPISLSKFIRAYQRSGYNPTCPEYSSIFGCFKSAARSGLIEQFSPSTNDIPTLYDIYQAQAKVFGEQSNVAEYNPDFMFTSWLVKLIGIAYKYDHVALAESLLSRYVRSSYVLHGAEVDRQVYWQLKSKLRHLLEPYKLKSNREIRREYYPVLFDPNVSDEKKRSIWQQKYAPNSLSKVLASIQGDTQGDHDLKFLVTVKLGGDILDYEDLTRDVALFVGQTGNLEIIQKTYEALAETYDMNRVVPMTYSIFQLLKKGYFEAANGLSLSENIFDGWIYVFDKKVFLAQLLTNFTLPQVESLVVGIQSVILKYRPESTLMNSLIHKIIVQGNNASLYSAYIRKYPTAEFDYLPRGLITNIHGLPIINDILFRKNEPDESLRNWWYRNIGLLVKIWQKFGRRQFEDSLIYMQSKFGYDIPRVLLGGLLGQAIRGEARSLLAYLFGYRIKGNEIEPLANPGILLLEKQFLRQYWQENRRSLARNIGPDVLGIILAIIG